VRLARFSIASLACTASLVFGIGCGDDDSGMSASGPADCLPPASASFVRPFEVDSEEYPFRSCAFQTSVGRIHYFDEGPRNASETILVVPGNPTWSFLYRNIAKAMIADGHRVISLDHLGMGMSDVPSTSDFDYRPRSHADHLEQLVLALDLRNVTVVGHDWGGPIGLGMATLQPERISRMLIMNTWAWSIDANDPGLFHALTDWSAMAKNFGRANPTIFCQAFLPGQSNLNATAADPTGGVVFDRVLSAYLSPAIDVTTGSFRHSEPCAAMQIFAESISDDDAFQGEVEARIGILRGKPYSLLFGLSDILFGALRCDTAQSTPCPGSSSCVCDTELLPARPGARCSETINQFHVCKEADGSVIEPYADRFVDLLGDESLVARGVVPESDHMIQEWAPERVIQALRDLLAAG
jgi:pimeloyl-ACP methyl ester carboxylesterase